MCRSRTVCAVFVFTSALLLASPVFVSCSDNGGEKTGADGSADATPDTHATPDASLAELTIIVEEAEPSATGPKLVPLQGASIALDQLGLPRQEATTDASGEATFQVDWAGPVDVIAAKAGYAISSFSGLTEPTGSVELRLRKITTPASATITGSAIGGDNTATGLAVTASTSLTSFQGPEKNYSLKVEAGKPSTIRGLLFIPGAYNKNFSQSLLGWATAEWDGTGTSATVDLDFDNPVAPTTFTGEIVPPAASCLMASSAFGWVEVNDYRFLAPSPFWNLGLLESRTFADNVYSFVGKYITPKAVTRPVTYYTLHTSLEWEQQSWVIKEGYPQDGARITGFLCEPTLTKPAPTELQIPQKLSTTFEWTSIDEFERAHITISKDTRVVWVASASAGSSSLSLPTPPSGFNLTDLLGTEALGAQLMLCAERDPPSMLCRRGSRSKKFRLAPSF